MLTTLIKWLYPHHSPKIPNNHKVRIQISNYTHYQIKR